MFNTFFYSYFISKASSNSEKRQIIASFRKTLSSSFPADKAAVEEFTGLIVSKMIKDLEIENYQTLGTVEKENNIRRVSNLLFPGIFKRKEDQAVMLDQIEELQKFLNLPAAKGLIKAIVFRSLESSLNIYESDLPTWKSHVTDLAMLSGTLSLATLGFEGLPLLFSAAIPTVFMWVDGPSVARHISRRKNLKTMKRREEELIDHSVSQRGIETVAAEVARDEAREDKADFQFGIIMKEIKDGLSVSEFYKLSQWGSGFDRGFVNIVDRHNSLKNRLDLIARELDPVLTELKNGSPDLSRLKSLQRLVEISSPQAQNLQMDINFLKTDYLALGIALDRYILDLDALSKDPDLLDRQRDQINRRRERLEMRKKNLETSAFALGPILALHESVIVSLEDYQDIISMDMSEKLRQ